MASAEVISSVIPSEKNSWPTSPERLRKGSTAIEMALAGSAAAIRSATTPSGMTQERERPIGNERGRDNGSTPAKTARGARNRTAGGVGGRSVPLGASLGRVSGSHLWRQIACSLLAAASDLREDSACLGLGLGIELCSQRVGERTIELDRGAAPSALAIVAASAGARPPHAAAQAAKSSRLSRSRARSPRTRSIASSVGSEHRSPDPGNASLPRAARIRTLRSR